jgi:hypothetical protein
MGYGSEMNVDTYHSTYNQINYQVTELSGVAIML